TSCSPALHYYHPPTEIYTLSLHDALPISVDFLEKPCNDQELLDAIQRALARSREGQAETAERQEIQRRVDSLTPREREVFALVVTGMLNKQIAGELGAAEKTIKVHRGRMMKKMRAESVAALVG